MGCLSVVGKVVYERNTEQLYYLSNTKTISSFHLPSNSFQSQIHNSVEDNCWIESFADFGLVNVGNDCHSIRLNGDLLFSTVMTLTLRLL